MEYSLLIYEDETIYGAGKDGAALHAIAEKHHMFMRDLGAARLGGAGLKSTTTATTVRKTNGSHAIHDGPFAESREQLGGST